MENGNLKSSYTSDGSILYIVLNGDRHTDEIKDIIDKNFDGIKIGTLYSIINRLKSAGLIREYRASSIDGSRRKYYSITPLGTKTYFKKFKEVYDGAEIPLPIKDNEVKLPPKPEKTSTKPIKQSKPMVEPELNSQNVINQSTDSDKGAEQVNYAQIISDSPEVSENIDFSIFEKKFNSENTIKNTSDDYFSKENRNNSQRNDFNSGINYDNTSQFDSAKNNDFSSNFTPYDNEILFNQQDKKVNEIDYDSVINPNYEYSSVLNKLFPKTKESEIVEESEQIDTQSHDDIQLNQTADNWDDIYSLAEREGIKITTSADTNRYQGSKILLSKLMFFASLLLFGVAIVEYFAMLLFIPALKFNSMTLVKIAVAYGAILGVLLIIYLLSPTFKVKDLPKFINVIEIALIITISVAIISFSIAAIVGIDYSNVLEIFKSIVLPSISALNVPIFCLIIYGLSKLDFFQAL